MIKKNCYYAINQQTCSASTSDRSYQPTGINEQAESEVDGRPERVPALTEA